MLAFLQKWLDKILLPKSTLELQDLNGLWERFNNGEDVEFELVSREWKHQGEKVQLLLDLHDLRHPNRNGN